MRKRTYNIQKNISLNQLNRSTGGSADASAGVGAGSGAGVGAGVDNNACNSLEIQFQVNRA